MSTELAVPPLSNDLPTQTVLVRNEDEAKSAIASLKERTAMLARITRNMEANSDINGAPGMLRRTGLRQMDWATGSFRNMRDMVKELGYPDEIFLPEYYFAYRRHGVARRIVQTFPEYSWMFPPTVYDESGSDATEFEKGVRETDKKIRMWNACKRLDTVTGLGRYGVMLLGTDDGQPLNQPLEKAKELIYLQPYREELAPVTEWDMNTSSRRYGQPIYYTLRSILLDEGNAITNLPATNIPVHWSRVIHVAEDCSESFIFGTPRLEAVWNDLLDLVKTAGGAAEMFWRGAFYGISFEMDKDAEIGTEMKTAMDKAIQEYIYGLTRYLKLQGTQAKPLSPQVHDPKSHVEVIFSMIAAGSKIPRRILTGSEQGKLASDQDAVTWSKVIAARQTTHVENNIVRPLIDRLVDVGILAPPKDDTYEVDWQDLHTVGDKEAAEVSKIKSDTIVAYANSAMPEMIPLQFYLVNVLGWPPGEADALTKELDAFNKSAAGKALADAAMQATAEAKSSVAGGGK